MLLDNYKRPAILLSFASLLCLASSMPAFSQDSGMAARTSADGALLPRRWPWPLVG